MNRLWQIYAGSAGLYSEAYITVKESPDGLWIAFRLCILVGLIAGLGSWFGIVTTWSGLKAVQARPTLAERVHETDVQVKQLAVRIEADAPSLPTGLEAVALALSEFLTTEVSDLLAILESEINAPGTPPGRPDQPGDPSDRGLAKHAL